MTYICSQSNDLYMRPTELVQHFAYRGKGVHIGASALLNMELIWFGYIAHLSQWGQGGRVYLLKWFLPAFAASIEERCGGGGGGQHPVYIKSYHALLCL